jgi:hypothetical protein
LGICSNLAAVYPIYYWGLVNSSPLLGDKEIGEEIPVSLGGKTDGKKPK